MKLTVTDRLVSWFSPAAGLRRLQARAAAEVLAERNYKAATPGHRTSGWNRSRSDVNAVTRVAGAELRMHARDLIRNNAWAQRGQQVIANNVVGWGIVPKPVTEQAAARTKAMEIWKAWADSTDCESEGRSTFYALQHQVMEAAVSDGEVLIRRRWRKAGDVGASGKKLALPFQLQLLESDFLDTSKEEVTPRGKIVQGVEYDLLGRRSAYWIFPEHPGSSTTVGRESNRIPAEDILHVFRPLRPGQARGVSWLAAAIVSLKDFDEWEDAELMRQKIASCFAAFVSDTTGAGDSIGTASPTDKTVDLLEPGMIHNLAEGETVTFGNPPTITNDSFAARQLRRVATAMGISYEDLTGDFSQVNFSSARMARLAHQGNVKRWQWHMLIPLLCDGVWRWAMEAAEQIGAVPDGSEISAVWTVDPLPMIEPDKEGLALSRLVRNGAMTFSDMVRQVGGDPETHWAEYRADQELLDEYDIKLDSDVRAVSQAGLTQARAGIDGGAPAKDDAPKAEEEKPKKAERADVVHADDPELSIRAEEIP